MHAVRRGGVGGGGGRGEGGGVVWCSRFHSLVRQWGLWWGRRRGGEGLRKGVVTVGMNGYN